MAFALIGCAARQDLRPANPGLPPIYERLDRQIAFSYASLDQWWVSFNDPELTAFIESALSTGLDTKLALARLAEARAIRSVALARYRINGDLGASANMQKTERLAGDKLPPTLESGNVDSATVNFNVSWKVDLFGRKAVTARAADSDLAAARFAYEGSRAALAAEVADTLFTVRERMAQQSDAQETQRIQTRLAGILRKRSARGLGADADTARVDADAAQAEAAVAQLEAELQVSKRALLILSGRGGQSTATLNTSPTLGTPPLPPQAFPGELMARRPDVREAEARLLAASARTDLQRLELFPRLTLNPGLGLNAQRSSDFSVLNLVWSFGLGLAVPILDRRRLMSELQAQGTRAEQAVIEYERAVQRAFAESEGALVRLDADRRRIAFLAAGDKRARTSLDAAEIKFSRGLIDLPGLLDAERTWRSSRQALTTARVDALRRSVQVFRALGGGWTPANSNLSVQGSNR